MRTEENNTTPRVSFPLWLKISFGIGIIIFLLISHNVTILKQTNAHKDAFWLILERYSQKIANAKLLEKLVIDMETGQRGFIITGSENFLEPYNNAIESFSKILQETKEIEQNLSNIKELDEINLLVNKWLNQAGEPEIQARRDADKGLTNMNQVVELVKAETGKEILDQIREKFNTYINNEKEIIKHHYFEAVNDIDKTREFGNVIILSSILISILMSFFIIKSVNKQLNIIVKSANEVAKGNFKNKIPTIPNNEFKVLAVAFNKMIDEIDSNLKYIKSHETELNKYKHNLESLVAKKTST